MPADQCAVGADGTLLDASQILWLNDPDDDILLLPSIPAASARCSTHIPCPAPKLVDSNNTILRKCKASTSRPVVVSEGSEEESEGDAIDKDDGVIMDAATDMDNEMDIDDITPSESAYQQTKEMSNEDHEGAKQCKSDLTADIRTIFTREAKVINPDTCKEETGH
ncbi:hypothetical protein BDR07DRAFT_1479323 [Suillus spraguei]|nr:hypothetical protein BDR07DRAFT_1479323 [Suillus spraguei]